MIAGIDLGTTHSLIGVFDAGFPTLVADNEGHRLTPSVVYFPEKGEPVIGRQALRWRNLAPQATISSIKRLMGLRRAEVAQGDSGNFAGQPGELVRLVVGEKEYTPEEISSFILRKLKSDAEASLGAAIDRAVITVPAYFNDAQRSATRRAGELAGFQVERIIAEPTAAALAYGLDRLKDKARVAVYDLGGGTFDLSILHLENGVFEVLSTHGDTHLGGDDMDAALARVLCEKLGWPLDKAESLRPVAEEAKCRLSEEESTDILLPFAEGGVSTSCTLTRTELEQICRPVIERTRHACLRALKDADIRAGDLDELILVGGATRMPLVRRFAGELFGRDPNVTQHPDEAVARGATIQAGILEGTIRGVTLLDVTPLSLGIETFGGLMNVLIPRNTTIPCKAGEAFTNAVAGQTGMRIRVLQGERELARDNWQLGELDVPLPFLPKGQAKVGVQFKLDADGLLHVLARDMQSGEDHHLEVRGTIDIADAAVGEMISASVDHAFEDMDARIFTEARLKADEMLPAVEAGLQSVGDMLDESERSRITLLSDKVRRAVEAKDTRALKEAVEELDDATEQLATLLLERAMGGE